MHWSLAASEALKYFKYAFDPGWLVITKAHGHACTCACKTHCIGSGETSRPATEQLAPSPSLNAPPPASVDLRQKRRGEGEEHMESMNQKRKMEGKRWRLYLNTDLRCPSSPAAHPAGSPHSGSLQSPGSPGLSRAVPAREACRPSPPCHTEREDQPMASRLQWKSANGISPAMEVSQWLPCAITPPPQ